MSRPEQTRVEDSITLTQYRLMRHTIGFERRRVKYGKYNAYRNYFCDRIDNDHSDWNNIVKNNLAIKRISSDCENMYYHLTEKGIALIADYEGCKIIEDR